MRIPIYVQDCVPGVCHERRPCGQPQLVACEAAKLHTGGQCALTQAPKTLTLTFSEAAQLARLVLVVGVKEISIPVDKTAKASQSFTLPLPELVPVSTRCAGPRWRLTTVTLPRALSSSRSPGKTITEASIVPISGWDLAALLTKAITYAGTLSAAGRRFLLRLQRWSFCKTRSAPAFGRSAASLAAATIASTATSLLLAASMGGDIAGMFDSHSSACCSAAAKAARAGCGSQGLIRTVSRLAISRTRHFQAPALDGAILAAPLLPRVGHIHALRPNTLPTLTFVPASPGRGLLAGRAGTVVGRHPIRRRRADRRDRVPVREGALGVVGTLDRCGARSCCGF